MISLKYFYSIALACSLVSFPCSMVASTVKKKKKQTRARHKSFVELKLDPESPQFNRQKSLLPKKKKNDAQKKINELEQRNQALNTLIGQRDNQIRELNNSIDNKTQEIRSKSEQINIYHEENLALQNELSKTKREYTKKLKNEKELDNKVVTNLYVKNLQENIKLLEEEKDTLVSKHKTYVTRITSERDRLQQEVNKLKEEKAKAEATAQTTVQNATRLLNKDKQEIDYLNYEIQQLNFIIDDFAAQTDTQPQSNQSTPMVPVHLTRQPTMRKISLSNTSRHSNNIENQRRGSTRVINTHWDTDNDDDEEEGEFVVYHDNLSNDLDSSLRYDLLVPNPNNEPPDKKKEKVKKKARLPREEPTKIKVIIVLFAMLFVSLVKNLRYYYQWKTVVRTGDGRYGGGGSHRIFQGKPKPKHISTVIAI